MIVKRILKSLFTLIVLFLFVGVLFKSQIIYINIISLSNIFEDDKPLKAELVSNEVFTYPLKSWIIKFSKKIDSLSISNKNVYIKCGNEKLNAKLFISEDRKQITITPNEKYKPWLKYTLIVEDTIYSIDKKKKLENRIDHSFDMLEYTFNSSINPNYFTFVSDKVAVNEEDYYNELMYAVENFDTDFTLTVKNCDKFEYSNSVFNTITDIYKDMPLLNYGFKGVSITISTSQDRKIKKMDIKLEYFLSKDKMVQMKLESEKKAKDIIQAIINPQMTDVQKEIAIHDYIVNNCKYDRRDKKEFPPQVYTDYGVLVEGSAVCDGYAKTFYRLLNYAKVPCIYVVGTADEQPHAWNIVNLNGKYCHVDATWNDSLSIEKQPILVHKYLNLDDNTMLKHHKWDQNWFQKATTLEYTAMKINAKEKYDNNTHVYTINNYNDFYNSIKEILQKKYKKIVFKIVSFDFKTYNVEETIKKVIKDNKNKNPYYGNIIFSNPSELENGTLEYVELLFKN